MTDFITTEEPVQTGYVHVEEPLPVLIITPPHEKPTPISAYVPPVGGLGCKCDRCGPSGPLPSAQVVKPGTPDHAVWTEQQKLKQAAYEARFAATAHLRPAHWGKG